MAVKNAFIFLLVLFWGQLSAQYAPGAGQAGTTAVAADSSAIVAWANSCSVIRGFINIEDTTQTYTHGNITSNRAFFGVPENAVGPTGDSVTVVSLGDGGIATLGFKNPITNGEGYDFAVFENGFLSSTNPDLYYLELAFVEVSTDGKHFVRFPSVSITQDSMQVGGFGTLNPINIHNLAGKYVARYGTPFDLQDLKDSAGINIDSINYIRVVDVVGDINPYFARHDSKGKIINDPYPTPYWTGGFDLDAVAVIHQKTVLDVFDYKKRGSVWKLFPNPVSTTVKISTLELEKPYHLVVFSIDGETVYEKKGIGKETDINVSNWPAGIYVVKILQNRNISILKMSVIH